MSEKEQERMRSSLLHSMNTGQREEDTIQSMEIVPSYNSEKGSQLDQAFEELKRPATDPLSCLRIAKAYVLEGRAPRNRRDEDNKGTLIRWLVAEALERKPSLFGPYRTDLKKYFDCLLTEETEQIKAWLKARDQSLSTIKRGDPFQDGHEYNKALQTEALSRLKAGKPLVIAITGAGYGDIIIMTPTVGDVAKTLQLIGSASRIRYVVRDKVAALVRYMLEDYKNVEVISYEGKNDALYLSNLALEQVPEVQFDVRGKSFIDGHEERAGIILAWEIENPAKKDNYVKSIVHLMAGHSEVFPIDDPDKVLVNSARESWQRDFSRNLGVKIFDNATRDDIAHVSMGLIKYIGDYLARETRIEVREHLAVLEKKPGFENGFICIVNAGSNDNKRITPSLASAIASQLASFCQNNNVGVLLLRSDYGDHGANENTLLKPIFMKHGIPAHQFFLTERVVDALVLMQASIAIIGPDTFLTHVGELFLDKPTVSFYADSAKGDFRIDNRVIAIQHPIGKQAEKNLLNYVPKISRLYASEIIHPFTDLSIDEEKSHYLVQVAQASFLEEVKTGMSKFERSILGLKRYDTGC